MQEAFNNSLRDEHLCEANGSHFFCTNCDSKVDLAKKEHSLAEIPPILLVTINRFYFDRATLSRQKIMTHMNIDHQLDIGGKTYSLDSIGIHAGRSLDGGHYYSICK